MSVFKPDRNIRCTTLQSGEWFPSARSPYLNMDMGLGRDCMSYNRDDFTLTTSNFELLRFSDAHGTILISNYNFYI